MLIGNTELKVSGRVLKTARLRHEWFEYLDHPAAFVVQARQARIADLLTFLQEAHPPHPPLPFFREVASASVLTFKNYEDWWTGLHFKARNKARKAQKTGVELRPAVLDDDFVSGVVKIYNETPVRQDRIFTHYGKSPAQVREDLSSFPERTFFVGAYHQGELIGFMKLFEGENILRFVHIIAAVAHRDKCVMDALIAKAVELAGQKQIFHLHYGDWAYRGLGVFRLKYGFDRLDCPRYYVPLNFRGELALNMGLHRPVRDRIPQVWIDRLVRLRGKWYVWRRGGGHSARED